MVSDKDKEFERRARALLNDTAELDDDVKRRLAVARALALQHMDRPARRWLLPATGVAAALMVGLFWFNRPSPDIPTAAELDDFELLLANENLEMLENLDFYEWVGMELPEDEETG